jgi:hypothetical protein
MAALTLGFVMMLEDNNGNGLAGAPLADSKVLRNGNAAVSCSIMSSWLTCINASTLHASTAPDAGNMLLQ